MDNEASTAETRLSTFLCLLLSFGLSWKIKFIDTFVCYVLKNLITKTTGYKGECHFIGGLISHKQCIWNFSFRGFNHHKQKKKTKKKRNRVVLKLLLF